MARQYRQIRDPKRGLARAQFKPRPDLKRIIQAYDFARQKRAMRILPDFFVSSETKLITVLMTCDNITEIRYELAIVLASDGSISNTKWLEQPHDVQLACTILAGFMSIHTSLSTPLAKVCDDQIPLNISLSADSTLEDVLSDIVQLARDWVNKFVDAYAESEDAARALVPAFQIDVSQIEQAASKLSLFLRYSQTNHISGT